MIEPFIERIEGRYSKKQFVILKQMKLLSRRINYCEIAKKITDAGIEQMYIRSAFTCNTRHGVCEKCYGKTLQQVKKLKWVKQLVQSLLNQSVNQVHSLQCVPSIQVGSRKRYHSRSSTYQEIFEARNPKGQAVSLKSKV